MSFQSTVQNYYSLTKPGVLYGNVITAVAGFFLASQGVIDWWLFLAVLIGTTLVIASACVINNFLDQDIDKIMERTKKRAIVSGAIPARNAAIFGTILGIVGFLTLIFFTNSLVVWLEVIGYVDYVVLYGMWSKRRSIHGTLVGSVSGAIPILAGYASVSGTIDTGAILVFLVLFFWQMPEFYSIAIFRHKEYSAAKVRIISVVKGINYTKKYILFYTYCFVISTLLLGLSGVAGLAYSIVMGILGAYWIYLGHVGILENSQEAWARSMFRFALVILLVFCFMISIDSLLP